MVRLKAVQAGLSIAGQTFQFQNGAIKSDLTHNRPCVIKRFQFQNGAIKSGRVKTTVLKLVCFNSKMVRLKGNCPN